MNKYKISCYYGKVLTAQFQVDQILPDNTPHNRHAKYYSRIFSSVDCSARSQDQEKPLNILYPCVRIVDNYAFFETPEALDLQQATESNTIYLNLSQEITVHISTIKFGWALVGMPVEVLDSMVQHQYSVERLPDGRQLRSYVSNIYHTSEIPFLHKVLINEQYVQRVEAQYLSACYKDSVIQQWMARHYDGKIPWRRNDNAHILRQKEMWDFVSIGYDYVASFVREDGLIAAIFHQDPVVFAGHSSYASELIVVE